MAAYSMLTLWTLSQALALAWLVLMRRSKTGARLALAGLFLWASWANWTTSRDDPEAYLGYAFFAWLEWYREFIDGWFAAHVRPFVGTIAVGQLVVAGLLAGKGKPARLGLVGATVFFAAISPLGIGSGFPFPLLLGVGALRLLGHVDESLAEFLLRVAKGPWGRALATWCGMLGLAFANGGLRELVFVPFVGEPWAHHLSSATAGLLFGSLVWTIWPRLGVTSRRQAWRIGAAWTSLTVATETLLVGRWLGGQSWTEILAAYDVLGGSSWPFVLAWVLVLPWLSWSFRTPGSLRPLAPSSASSH